MLFVTAQASAEASALSIAQCKMLPDGQSTDTGPVVVTAVLPTCYYVEQKDRACGIRVLASGSLLQVGSWVTLSGVMATTSDRERCIINPVSTPRPDLTGAVSPLRLNGRDLGGGDWYYQPGTGAGQKGVAGSSSLNNIGLLVRLYGEVKEIEQANPPTWFTIDDGSGSVKVEAPAGVSISSSWKHAIVTGICSCEPAAIGARPVLLVRDVSDIVTEDGNLTAVAIARPGHAAPMQAVSFDGLLSTCSAVSSIATYEWDFDYDGHAFDADATGPTPSFTYTSFGLRTVALRATTGGAFPSSAVATTNVFVDAGNLPPIADPGGPYVQGENEMITLNTGDYCLDPNQPAGDRIVSYEWDLNNDGIFGEAVGQSPSFTWAQLAATGPYWGTRNIGLRVTDMFGASAHSTTTLSRCPNDPVAAFLASKTTVPVGQPVVVDGGASYHPRPDRQIVSYEWDFDYDLADFQANDAGVIITYTPTAMGTRNIALRVTDNSTPPRTSIVYHAISATITNRSPVAVPGGPYVINQGEKLFLYADGSYDPDVAFGDRITSYEWDLNDDGVYDITDAVPVQALTFTQLQAYGLGNGTRKIRLRATDTFGASGTATAQLTIYANQPTASFTEKPWIVNPGYAITFDGSSSSQDRPDRRIVSYEWDFDYNGTFGLDATGAIVTHSYAATGAHIVALRVTDDNTPARTNITTRSVSIVTGNMPPFPNPGGPYTIDTGSALYLDGSGSFDPNDTIVSYSWDINDDRTFGDATGAKPTISWAQLVGFGLHVGTNTISLKVTDSLGSSKLQSTEVNIYNNQPTASLAVSPGTTVGGGQQLSFDGGASTAGRPDRHIVSYEWDFDYNLSTFNPSATGATATKTYPSIGSHRAALRVTDDNSPARTSIVWTLVNIEARSAPVAVVRGPIYIDKGYDWLQLDGTGSYDPDAAYGDSITSYSWDINGDGVFGDVTGVSPSLTWAQIESLLSAAGLASTGRFTIALRVTDTTGRQHVAQTSMTIREDRPFARIRSLVTNAGQGQPITFDGSLSYHGLPQQHRIVRYEWDFDYRNWFECDAVGATTTYAYSMFGTYTVALRVIDDDFIPKSDITTFTLNVDQGMLDPVAHPGGPYTVASGSSLTLNGSQSRDPHHPTLSSLKWDLNGDGVFTDAIGTSPTLTWAQLSGLGLGVGSHTIWLEVKSAFGRTNRSYTRLDIK